MMSPSLRVSASGSGLCVLGRLEMNGFSERKEFANYRTIGQGVAIVPSVSVVIPAKNEARNLEHVFATIPEWVDEIVLVSDTEPDQVLAISFWNARPDAELYRREQFPKIQDSVRQLLETEPVIRTFNVHTYVGQKIAAEKAA